VLANGDFELVRDDGTPYGWRKIGGTLSSRAGTSHAGTRSLALSSNGTSSTKWAYQTVRVTGGAYYAASVFAHHDDAALAAVFLRVSWYGSEDGSGEAIGSDDSTVVLESLALGFRELSTGPIQAPNGARTAKLRLMIRPRTEGNGTAFFDDATFVPVSAPTEEPTPSATAPTPLPSATTAPTGQAPTPSPSPQPATPTAHPTTRPTGTPTPASEPAFFDVLTNGGFELVREDETPYGWHKNGGVMTASDSQAFEGQLSLALRSDSESTKWAYQTVKVQPGVFYEASAWAMNGGAEAEVRLSWYVSENGAGEAISTAESEALNPGPGSFRFLTTGPVEAPAGALSAKVRLLVRPATGDAITVFFDGASLATTNPGAAVQAVEQLADSARVVAGAQSAPREATAAIASSADEANGPGHRGLVRVENVRPAGQASDPEHSPVADKEGFGRKDLFIALLIGLPLIGIAALAANDVARSRRDQGL
jgi:hypothetical protein